MGDREVRVAVRRQIINARRAKLGQDPLSEDDLLYESLQKGYSSTLKAEELANSIGLIPSAREVRRHLHNPSVFDCQVPPRLSVGRHDRAPAHD